MHEANNLPLPPETRNAARDAHRSRRAYAIPHESAGGSAQPGPPEAAARPQECAWLTTPIPRSESPVPSHPTGRDSQTKTQMRVRSPAGCAAAGRGGGAPPQFEKDIKDMFPPLPPVNASLCDISYISERRLQTPWLPKWRRRPGATQHRLQGAPRPRRVSAPAIAAPYVCQQFWCKLCICCSGCRAAGTAGHHRAPAQTTLPFRKPTPPSPA